mmetsp:Transcript_2970/g.9880  ORF Transcript_2970/g.9880 Transcript_2970/m.9880 type:complete len:155 (+) Transcript_2970:1903-2367(+)
MAPARSLALLPSPLVAWYVCVFFQTSLVSYPGGSESPPAIEMCGNDGKRLGRPSTTKLCCMASASADGGTASSFWGDVPLAEALERRGELLGPPNASSASSSQRRATSKLFVRFTAPSNRLLLAWPAPAAGGAPCDDLPLSPSPLSVAVAVEPA